ncbi:MAG: hypothetical protein KA419_20040 [Acidobacteria bacterium]|nr:hypothetical protein [Acidobacteriota bacterium]
MNRNTCRWTLALLAVALSWAVAPAQIGGKYQLNAWSEYQAYFSLVGNSYGFADNDVIAMREMGILEDELPLLFFIANRAHCHPRDVARYRLGHHSWMDVSRHYRLGPDAYYLQVDGYNEAAFGGRYSYLGYPRDRWSAVQFQDADLVYLANAHMLSRHYRVSPLDVYRGALGGKRFYQLEQQYRSGGMNPPPPSGTSQGQPPPKKKKYAFQE